MEAVLCLVVALLTLPACLCNRRIVEGTNVDESSAPSFVVYIIENQESASLKYPDRAWLCGGAIIHELFVLTSGACLADVTKDKASPEGVMWVVSGTLQYFANYAGASDCVRNNKRNVVTTYISERAKFDYKPVSSWVRLDIGIARVDKPFTIDVIEQGCQYAVTKVAINFDEAFQKEGTDAIVYGWGHDSFFRKPEETNNLNSQTLQYAPVKLISKEECKREWSQPGLNDLITNYMICTWGAGSLDDKGDPVNVAGPAAGNSTVSINGVNYMIACPNSRRDDQPCVSDGNCVCPNDADNTRRDDDEEPTVAKFIVRNGLMYWRTNKRVDTSARVIPPDDKKRIGFCQNDHGGPLVSWVGARMKLLGVASAFLTEREAILSCKGPYIYSSTHCNGAFIQCVLNKHGVTPAPANLPTACKDVTKKGLRIVETLVYLRKGAA